MDVTITIKVTSKSQTQDPDGTPKYTSNFLITTDGVDGSFMAITSDSTTDDFFIVGDSYDAVISPH